MADKEKQKLPLIAVRSKGDDHQVLCWERHPDHPEEGEAFIVNDGATVEVAETSEIKRLIGEGKLVAGNSGDIKTKKKDEEPSTNDLQLGDSLTATVKNEDPKGNNLQGLGGSASTKK